MYKSESHLIPQRTFRIISSPSTIMHQLKTWLPIPFWCSSSGAQFDWISSGFQADTFLLSEPNPPTPSGPSLIVTCNSGEEKQASWNLLGLRNFLWTRISHLLSLGKSLLVCWGYGILPHNTDSAYQCLLSKLINLSVVTWNFLNVLPMGFLRADAF